MKTPRILTCGKHKLDISSPCIMGILNTTPDSFSDGGRHYTSQNLSLDSVLKHAESMLAAGAAIIDVGGESTRPGSLPVSEQQELDRVAPVVEALVTRFDALVSVDTSNAQVITEAARVGAGIINDVRALTREGALEAAAKTGLPVCLMHMKGTPATMQEQPAYADVLDEVHAYLLERVVACESAGIAQDRIILDPGFGFGKSLEHNFELLRRLPEILALGYPLLIGFSRKTMFGQLLNRAIDERLPGSLAGALIAAQKGAHIIRVHDVAETADVLRVLKAIELPLGIKII